MATSNVRLAIKAARTAYDAFSDYRDRKAAEAYDALSHAAETYTIADLAHMGQEKGRTLIDDSRESAGKVAENARIRLEKARSEAANQASSVASTLKDNQKQVAKSAKKSRKQLSKKTAKQQRLMEKRACKLGLKKKKSAPWGKLSLLIALLGSIAGALYWFIFRPEKPGTKPPRVEDHTTEESTLVYSTSTPVEETAADREFLDDLDKQLAQHRVNDSEVADDAVDEALDEDIDRLDDLQAQADQVQEDYDRKHGKE